MEVKTNFKNRIIKLHQGRYGFCICDPQDLHVRNSSEL
jgi:hypothetical protein